jgi:hypothetical protein
VRLAIVVLAACGSAPPSTNDRALPVTPLDDPTPAETVRFAALEPLPALPADWSVDPSQTPRGWRDVELGYDRSTYLVVATRGDKRWSAQLECCADGFNLDSFERGPTIAGVETASIVFDVKRIELVACARAEATVLRCSAAIELHNGDLRDELDVTLVPTRDGLLLSPNGAGHKRRLVFALP